MVHEGSFFLFMDHFILCLLFVFLSPEIAIYGIMKRFCLFCLCLLGFSVWGASDQVVEKVLDIFEADSLPGSNVAVTADSDSVHLSTVKKELAAARLNEANLRMEIEQMKLAAYTADSVKLASQRRRIDSLRHETRGVPVVVDGDTLFYFYAKRGGDILPSSVQRTWRMILRPWANALT